MASVIDLRGNTLKAKAIEFDEALELSGDANLTNVDAGAAGVAGTIDIFPTTTAKGKIEIVAADSAGDTTTTITNASQAGARTYTIPDAGASASFVMTAGAQTVGGAKTFSTMPIIPVNTPVAGTGTNLATAAQLASGFTVITGANGTVAWKLPATPAPGTIVIVKGTTAGVAVIFPDAAATINAIGSNGAISLASGVIPAIFIAASATQWYTLPLLPS